MALISCFMRFLNSSPLERDLAYGGWYSLLSGYPPWLCVVDTQDYVVVDSFYFVAYVCLSGTVFCSHHTLCLLWEDKSATYHRATPGPSKETCLSLLRLPRQVPQAAGEWGTLKQQQSIFSQLCSGWDVCVTPKCIC